jgi:hypothetical protein
MHAESPRGSFVISLDFELSSGVGRRHANEQLSSYPHLRVVGEDERDDPWHPTLWSYLRMRISRGVR